MKKILLLLPFILLNTISKAQFVADAILFTENGERFTAILNGVRQNDNPETNVKITSLNAEFYKLKVIFENSALGERNFNLGLQLGMENTYVIKKNNKGEYVLRFMSAVPIAQAAPRPASQPVIVYHEHPVAAPAPVPVTGASQTITTTTTTQGVSQTNPDAVNINMGINIDGMGGGINMNVSGMDAGMNMNQQTTVTHTTTTTTTTTGGGMPVPTSPAVAPAPIVYLPGYNGPIGCPVPMSPPDFDALRASIASKSFEQTKYTMATQVLGDRCMFVSQVKQVMLLFTFEETRLDFARFAYDHTYDIGNYFLVNDAFTFETSIEELNAYIQSRR